MLFVIAMRKRMHAKMRLLMVHSLPRCLSHAVMEKHVMARVSSVDRAIALYDALHSLAHILSAKAVPYHVGVANVPSLVNQAAIHAIACLLPYCQPQNHLRAHNLAGITMAVLTSTTMYCRHSR